MNQSEHAALSELPPSALLVYRVLKECRPLTKQEICAESYLCASTAGSALTKLIDAGLIEDSPYHSDLRKREYHLVTNHE